MFRHFYVILVNESCSHFLEKAYSIQQLNGRDPILEKIIQDSLTPGTQTIFSLPYTNDTL